MGATQILLHYSVSSPGESAGFFGENGSLSPVADRGTGSTGLSGGTWHFHPQGKCREFLRFWFTFPRGSQGHRSHRHLWRHSQFPPVMRLLKRSSRACLGKCLVYRHSGKGTLLDLGSNGGSVAKSGQSSKFSEHIYLIIKAMHLSYELDIVKVLDSAFLGHRYDSPLLKTLSFHARIGGGRHRTYAHRSLLPTVLPGVRSSLMIVCKLHVNGAAIAP